MAFNDLINGALTSSGRVRNEPVQARSSERIATLLDAASAVVAEVGIERLTTAMVAERASASIGTVYRYFPDRIAVLGAMSLRGFERFLRTSVDNLEAAKPTTLDEAVDCLIEAAVHLHAPSRATPPFGSATRSPSPRSTAAPPRHRSDGGRRAARAGVHHRPGGGRRCDRGHPGGGPRHPRPGISYVTISCERLCLFAGRCLAWASAAVRGHDDWAER